MPFKSHLSCTRCHIVRHIFRFERLSLGDVRAIAKTRRHACPVVRLNFDNLLMICKSCVGYLSMLVVTSIRFVPTSFSFLILFPSFFLQLLLLLLLPLLLVLCLCWMNWNMISIFICLGKTGQYWFPLLTGLTADRDPYNFPSFIQLTNIAHLQSLQINSHLIQFFIASVLNWDAQFQLDGGRLINIPFAIRHKFGFSFLAANKCDMILYIIFLRPSIFHFSFFFSRNHLFLSSFFASFRMIFCL